MSQIYDGFTEHISDLRVQEAKLIPELNRLREDRGNLKSALEIPPMEKALNMLSYHIFSMEFAVRFVSPLLKRIEDKIREENQGSLGVPDLGYEIGDIVFNSQGESFVVDNIYANAAFIEGQWMASPVVVDARYTNDTSGVTFELLAKDLVKETV